MIDLEKLIKILLEAPVVDEYYKEHEEAAFPNTWIRNDEHIPVEESACLYAKGLVSLPRGFEVTIEGGGLICEYDFPYTVQIFGGEKGENLIIRTK